MLKATAYLFLWLIAAFVAVEVALPNLLPGRPNIPATLIAMVCPIAGAWFVGRTSNLLPLFFIYGCVGGLLLIPLFYPGRRGFLAQSASSGYSYTVRDWTFTIACILGVVGSGLLCRYVAQVRHERVLRRTGRCSNCGYSLRGLTIPRCPECGLPFDELTSSD